MLWPLAPPGMLLSLDYCLRARITRTEHGALRTIFLGRPAKHCMLDPAAPVRRHHDQVDRLLLGVVDQFLNRMPDHGERE